MRNTLIALGAIGSLAAALAACGGGGSGTTPATLAPAAVPSGVPLPNTVSNFTGPSSRITVSIAIPQHTLASAAVKAKIQAQYGSRLNNARVRTMWNVSPSATMRTWAQAQNRLAYHYEQSTHRDPTFVSGYTGYMEFVLSDTNSDVLVDQTVQCHDGTCTMSINAPVGSGFVASLYLYDYCGYLLSAGSTSNVAVTTGTNPPLTILLDGVVYYFDLETTANTPLIDDVSQAQTFGVNIYPYDIDYENITTPGTLVDYTLTPITGVDLSVDQPDPHPTGTTLVAVPTAVPSPYPSVAAITLSKSYTFAGTTNESGSVDFTAVPVTSGNPVTPNLYSYGYSYPTQASTKISLTALPVQLIWTNPAGFPNPEGSPGYYVPSPSPSGNTNTFIPQFSQIATNIWAFEFPSLNNGQGGGQLGLQEIAVQPSSAPIPIPFGGSINLTDTLCSGVFSYPSPGPLAYPSPPPSYGLVFNVSAFNLASPNPGPSGTPCTVQATDNSVQARTAYLNVYYDSSSLTIQSRARGTK
jgi:hypothetical protein